MRITGINSSRQCADVTPSFFHVLRVNPEAGRILVANEALDQVQTVAISDSFAKQHFQSVSEALGKTYDLGGVESTVIGVMPPPAISVEIPSLLCNFKRHLC